MFDRVLNTSMKFMWYYIFYVIVVSKNSSFTKVITSIASATLPGVEKLIKNPPFYENKFCEQIWNKNFPHQGSNVPKVFFCWQRWKKLRVLGTGLPTKFDILKVYYYTSKTIRTRSNYGYLCCINMNLIWD